MLSIMMQSFIAMGVVALIWFACGFSLAFGADVNGVIGNLQYAFLQWRRHGAERGLCGNHPVRGVLPVPAHVRNHYASALITGAFADRMPFKSYLIFLSLWSLLVYVPSAHWVWGGGFLQKMGVADFAGGIAIHTSAGIAALVSVLVLGKRTMQKGEEAKPGSLKLFAIGTAILWFGWFGFNGGSALAANGKAAIAFVNTALAGGVTMLTWLAISWNHTKHPSLAEALTGAVAGFVAITPAAGYVCPLGGGADWACCGVCLLRRGAAPAQEGPRRRAGCSGRTRHRRQSLALCWSAYLRSRPSAAWMD